MSQSWPDPLPAGGDTVAPTQDDRNWALGAHLGSLVTAWFAFGLIAPLIVLVIRGGRSTWLRRHTVESLNFNINALFWGVALTFLTAITFGLALPVLIAYGAFYLVCIVIASMRASRGQTFRYPLTLRLVS